MSFNFTVAITPSNSNLDSELQYVKSALLYADKVTLISPLAYMLTQLTDEKYQQNEKSVLRLINMVIPLCEAANENFALQAKPVIKEFSYYINSKKYKNYPMTEKLKIRNDLRAFAVQIGNVMYKKIGETSCMEIQNLLKSNKLVLQKFEHALSDVDGCISEFFNLLQQSVKSAFPLFDEQSNRLMALAVEEGLINLSDTDERKITHAGLSDNYIRMLPSFDSATVNEILDIRNELSSSLERFRSKMLIFSDQIKSMPWDKDFQEESMLLYYRDVVPAILEINELTQENTFIKNLFGNIIGDKEFMKTAVGLGIVIATTGLIPSFSQTVSSNTAVLSAGGAWAVNKIAVTFRDYHTTKRIISKNDLFFYYKAGKQLSNKHR